MFIDAYKILTLASPFSPGSYITRCIHSRDMNKVNVYTNGYLRFSVGYIGRKLDTDLNFRWNDETYAVCRPVNETNDGILS